MEIIQATTAELDELISFYRIVTDHMEENAMTQWHWGTYPNEDMIREDVEAGRLYYLRQDDEIAAAVVAATGQDPEYVPLTWNCGLHPGVFHRLAVHPSMQGAGLGGLVLDDVQQLLRRSGCDCIRCDTSDQNRAACRLYEKMGFRRGDRMRWEDAPDNFVTFDKPLKRETPIWPIRMTPAFRDGALTPWGGTGLAEVFGKQAKDERTGESLEVSCIPGLESADHLGRKLPELIRHYGEKLIGRCVDGPFPLLLKLIDAKEKLSVQVHPDDAYAAARENGKLGKNEAWLILRTPEEGGEIIYGIRPGTTKQELRDACRKGEPEPLLNRVTVRPGDVCYIPSGCVHAIGAGIMLYEIQESSDVTYRFYDWDRTDAEGKKRELHLDKALDVTNLKLELSPVRAKEDYGITRVLAEKSFTLDLLRVSGIETLPELHEFGLLTVTEGELLLRWASASVKMKAGDTCLLARNSPELAVEGIGTAALAMPG